MALWHCENCTTAYAVGLERCPHCGTPSRQLTSLPEAVEGDSTEREHPGTGEPGEPVEAVADGTEHELVVDEPSPDLPEVEPSDEPAPKPKRRKADG